MIRFAALATLGLYLTIHSATANEKPNILVITIDDMSCDSVGIYGCALPATTPNMDQLAARCMRFEYAHVQVGNCMPSRNVMWSGRYPHNNGVEGFYQVKEANYPTLCSLAKEAGYYTAIRHKVSHSTPYSPYLWDEILDTNSNGTQAHVKDAKSYGDSTAQAFQAAQSAGKPLCLLINIADPHKPFYSEVKSGTDPHIPSKTFTAAEVPVPGFLPDDPVIRDELARYYSSVRRADDAVAAVLRELDRSGESENTVIVFLADHGMPLPFAKTQLYHHSTRTPLMIRWPRITKGGSVDYSHMVSAVDLLPTLLDIVGLTAPTGIDGRSFAPVLRGERQEGRDFIIKEYNENSGSKRNPMRAIQTKEYLYIFNPWSNGTRKMATATNGTDTYKRMKQLAATDSAVARRIDLADFRTVEELYRVDRDPDCLVNVIKEPEHQAAADSLRNQLLASLQASNDPLAAILHKRNSASATEAYMLKVQSEADARRAAKKQRQAAHQPKVAKQRVFQRAKCTFVRTTDSVSATLAYKLPASLGTQKIHVTLKDSAGKRIERQVVEIRGTGQTQLRFKLPEYSPDRPVSVAAFIGEAYATNIQHIQSRVD